MTKIVNDWQEAAEHLADIKGAIERDLVPILSFPRGAPHTVIREWACYVDYLGSLLTGPAPTQGRFTEYLVRVLSQVDRNYKERADIILHMFRHGTVHEFDPKVLVNKAGGRLGWGVYKTPDRQGMLPLEDGREVEVSHLNVTKHLNLDGQLTLWVSTHCLVDDLIKSIQLFASGIGDPQERINNWNRIAKKLSEPSYFDFHATPTEP